MEMKGVKSSNIKAIGYEPTTRELHVEFNDGAKYIYDDVSPEHHAALVAAPSHGKHLAKNIVGKFKHRKVDPA